MMDYRGFIKDNSEPEYAAFSSKLIPDTRLKLMGVRIPKLRGLAKTLIRDGSWRAVLEDDIENFEEHTLHGLIIATAPVGLDERISMTERFLPTIDNWSVCDSFSGSWSFHENESAEAWNYLASLMGSDQPWKMRFSLVSRMSSFKDPEHSACIVDDIVSHDNPEYYYRMGAAWAFSFCFIRNRDYSLKALESKGMEVWTHNKSIQKIRESLRVSAEDKATVSGLRIRNRREDCPSSCDGP